MSDTTKPSTQWFGWCGPIANAANVKMAGFDYVELQLVPMRLEDDQKFADAKAAIAELPLPGLAFSYLFPHDVRIVGDAVDESRNRRYFERVVALLMQARARIVVLGSGWTRNVPEGWDVVRAEAQFLETLSWCADALQGTGTTLVIEPLNRKESNFVNSVAEGVRFAKALNRSEVRGLADFYHMDEEREPLSTLADNAAWIGHIHLADTGRMNPGTGTYDYGVFFGHLKRAGYRGLMSAECGIHGDPVDGMRLSANYLRREWREA